MITVGPNHFVESADIVISPGASSRVSLGTDSEDKIEITETGCTFLALRNCKIAHVIDTVKRYMYASTNYPDGNF